MAVRKTGARDARLVSGIVPAGVPGMQLGIPGAPQLPTGAARIFPAVVESAVELGADREQLLREAGMLERDLERSARLPVATLGLLIDAALSRTGDEALMLRVASAVTKDAYGIVSHLAYSSDRLADALRVLVRHFAFCCDAVVPAATIDEQACEVEFTLAPEASYMSVRARCALTEAAAAIMLLHMRNAAGLTLVPVDVSFRHQGPAELLMHGNLFGVVPRFRAEEDALRFAPEAAALPCAHPDAELRAVLEPYAEVLLTRRYRDAPWTQRTLAAVSELLALGEPRIEEVASQLHLSLRSLQRRLREESTSFSEIVDSARHTMAMRYLAQDELNASEIAYRLGFADVSSFHRAFRRWTGQTVSSFRRHG